MRLLTIVLLGLLCWLQYDFWTGKNGMDEYRSVQNNIQIQERANAELELRNQQMYAEINNLHGGNEAVEERARSVLGLIKPNETFFRIVGDDNDDS
ncbi:cell division protein FtsB [Photobacterium damselae subsp. piscicida]|nr:cell division protein FtsB [Photobacterium damselae subsp. piscicida]